MKKFSFHLFKNLPANEKKITISTVLTLIRFILIPFIVTAMIYNRWHLAFILFVLGSITDVLDGWIARHFNQRTFLGAALDPITDKIFVIALYSTLAFIQPFLFRIPLWFVLLVLIKEMIQITGAIIIYSIRGYLNICPTYLGKGYGMVQTAFITWLFSCHFFHWAPIKTYYAMLGGVISLVILTFIDYARIGYSYLRS